MKNVKDYMPSDESEVIDLRKMQGPPDRAAAEALRTKKSWIDYIDETDRKKKEARDNFSKNARASSKDSSDYSERMKKYDAYEKQKEEEDSQSSLDATRAWERQQKKPSYRLRKNLKDISSAFKKSVAKTKPLRKAEGGLVRGAGSARGVKPYKVR